MNLQLERVAALLLSTFGQRQTAGHTRQRYIGSTKLKTITHTDNPEGEWWRDILDIFFYYDGLEDEDHHDEQSNDDSNDTQPGSSRHDVEEYDDALSAYLDAQKRMNELQLSRGFHFLVAHRLEDTTRPQMQDGTKGERRDGKRPRLSATPGVEGSTCHWSRDCTLPSTKRLRVGLDSLGEVLAVVNSEPEFLHDAFLTSMDSCSHDAVLDGGAPRLMVGQDTLTRDADHLKNMEFIGHRNISTVTRHFALATT